MVVDVSEIVIYTYFGDHRLRRFWVARGQISPSPIDFHRRLYNTERVMDKMQFLVLIFAGLSSKLCNVSLCSYKYIKAVFRFAIWRRSAI